MNLGCMWMSVAQIGNYHLDGAYGGWALHKITNKSGGIVDVLERGYAPKRDTWNYLQAMIIGIQIGKATKK